GGDPMCLRMVEAGCGDPAASRPAYCRRFASSRTAGGTGSHDRAFRTLARASRLLSASKPGRSHASDLEVDVDQARLESPGSAHDARCLGRTGKVAPQRRVTST